MALMKPGFYMLAKHGPWEKHVRTKGMDAMQEAVMWLARQGKAENIDYEVLIEDIENKNSVKTFVPARPGSSAARQGIAGSFVIKPEPIMFFNDTGLASYVKLTWG